jgi:hypothetical protein
VAWIVSQLKAIAALDQFVREFFGHGLILGLYGLEWRKSVGRRSVGNIPKCEVFVGSVIKKRRKRMSKKKHRKLLRKTRHQRRNKK